MTLQENYVLTQFGIDEVYIHEGFGSELLEKLQRRAVLSLDADETIVKNHVTYDMILIFYKRVPKRNLIYRFLQFLDRSADKEDFIKSNTLINEEELLSAVQSKNFILVTSEILMKETNDPS